MQKIKNIQQAYDADGLDANAVSVTGIPERHIEAVKAFAHLCMVNDFVNNEFNPDFSDFTQRKYNPVVQLGSSSGPVFSYYGYGCWAAHSDVGARLVSESIEASKHIFEAFPELYEKMMVYQRKIK
jgi:hypothetical protein